jgi:hypothetical protein
LRNCDLSWHRFLGMASFDASALKSLVEDNAMILLCLAAGVCQAAGTLALLYYSTRPTSLQRKTASMTRAVSRGPGKERRAGKSNRTESSESRVPRISRTRRSSAGGIQKRAMERLPSVLSGKDSSEFFETMGRGLEQEINEQAGTDCTGQKRSTDGLRLLLSALRRTGDEP